MVGWEGHLDGKNAAVQNVVVARRTDGPDWQGQSDRATPRAVSLLHSSLDHPVLRHLFANASDLFAVADYRRMWAIGAFCGVARWLEFVAIAIFAYELTHSPELVALLAVLRMLPYVLLGFGMGALADAIDRKSATDRKPARHGTGVGRDGAPYAVRVRRLRASGGGHHGIGSILDDGHAGATPAVG